MDMKKLVVGSISGGVVLFLLGFLVYGFIITESPGMAPEGEMVLWAIILGSLFSGMLLTLVLGWRGAANAGDAAKAGGAFGLVMALAFGFMAMGTMAADISPDMGRILLDGVVAAVMYGVAGAVIAMVTGGKAEA